MKKIITIDKYTDKFEIVRSIIDMIEDLQLQTDHEVIITMETSQ